jgi:hypothetical protein
MNSLIALAIFLAVTVLAQAGKDAERDAKIEREAAERKQDVKPEQRIELIHPLPYSATVSQCNPECKTRYYVRSK